jgi:RNA polymerase sigma-70 factor (ECF subfamily)
VGPDDPLSEETLTRRFAQGDAAALCALFERHDLLLRARAERVLPASLRRRVSVSDILQESRIAALETHERFEPEGAGAFRRWALGIVENKAQRAVQQHRTAAKRSSAREVTRSARAATGEIAGRSPSPSQVAIGRETADQIRRAFESLSADDREVLRLHRDEGLALAEVAQRMGRSYEAVKKLYGRAAARFAGRFAEICEESRGGA